jgi:epoxyqueuosine reductase
MRAETVRRLARECGFDLAGIAPAGPLPEFHFYRQWVEAGMAGEMSYLTGRRAEMRADPGSLLASARSIVCVGKLYDGSEFERGGISRYALGHDYHQIVRDGLKKLVERLKQSGAGPFYWKICVDTAPLLERACARRAGLGWIGKNTCLIHQRMGSWFFLGVLLVSLGLEPDGPPPERCGTCTRCIDACPTRAIIPTGRAEGPAWALDARRCISYLTIELRGAVPESLRSGIGPHVFGCDICQQVCPWNRKAPLASEPSFAPRRPALPLEQLVALSEQEFRDMFRRTPVLRCRYTGFLRNVAVAMGNAALEEYRRPLERLARFRDPLVQDHARWALARLQ